MMANATPNPNRVQRSFTIAGGLSSLAAMVVIFLPFAVNTSPLDALLLRVPGEQGNWWHAFIGAPFLLAFPMVWLHLLALSSERPFPVQRLRIIWLIIILSLLATVAVETPFLLHLAGTNEWQRLTVLSVGFGVMIVSAMALWWRRTRIHSTLICTAGLITAYLANAALCLVVYSDAPGPSKSKSGWFVTMLIIWPLVLELVWIYRETFRTSGPGAIPTLRLPSEVRR